MKHPMTSGCIVHYPTPKNKKRGAKKRKRKTSDQLRVLQNEFQNQLVWTKETMALLAQKTGLSEAQVYKWGWDQKKKIQFQESKQPSYYNLQELFGTTLPFTPIKCIHTPISNPGHMRCHEIIFPSDLDHQLFQIQLEYRKHLEEYCKSRTH